MADFTALLALFRPLPTETKGEYTPFCFLKETAKEPKRRFLQRFFKFSRKNDRKVEETERLECKDLQKIKSEFC